MRPGDGMAAFPAGMEDVAFGVITTDVVPIEELPVAAGAADDAYSLSAIRGRPQYVYVDVPAALETRISSRYPRVLADRKVGGAVTLWVLVSQTGTVADTRVLRSSGYPELDQAAIQALRPARYRPAQRGGIAVPTWTQQQIVFRLE